MKLQARLQAASDRPRPNELKLISLLNSLVCVQDYREGSCVLDINSPYVREVQRQAASAWVKAGLGTGSWDRALALTAKGINVETAVLFSPAESVTAGEITGMVGAARGMMPLYAAEWAHRDPWTIAARKAGAFEHAGLAKLGRLVVPHKELLKTDFYNEFGRHWGGDDIACLKVCDEKDTLAVETHLSFFRGNGQQLFEEDVTRYLMDLWPHIQRAIHSFCRLEAAREEHMARPKLLERVPSGVFVLRTNGWIDYMNAAALSLVTDLNVKMVNPRRFRTLPGIEDNRFQELLRVCTQGLGENASATVSKRGTPVRLRWSFMPIREDPAYSCIWPHACALVTVERVEVAENIKGLLADFAAQHNLTNRESEVLMKLAKGRDLPTAARDLGMGYATVRSHVASILAKTGCTRQTELLAMVLGLK